MKRILLSMIAGTSMLFSAGCATKNYVHKEVAPVANKLNELDERAAANTNGIREVEERATAGIASVNAKAGEADQKALAAGKRAGEAQGLASGAVTRAQSLSDVVANLDSYRPVAESSVHFGFDKADLTKQSKEDLDALVQKTLTAKGYIVELTGGTDTTGNRQYNYKLSERRANAVVQYLVTNHNVPTRKIFVIGLGADKEVSPNSTRSGRAENRRVEIRILSNAGVEMQTSASSRPASNQ